MHLAKRIPTNMSRIDHLKTFLKESPDDSFLKFALAKEYEKNDDLEKALSFYQQIELDDPQYVGLYYHLGKLHFSQGRLHAALETYNKGMKIAKAQNDQHAFSELATAKLEIDEDDLED